MRNPDQDKTATDIERFWRGSWRTKGLLSLKQYFNEDLTDFNQLWDDLFYYHFVWQVRQNSVTSKLDSFWRCFWRTKGLQSLKQFNENFTDFNQL